MTACRCFSRATPGICARRSRNGPLSASKKPASRVKRRDRQNQRWRDPQMADELVFYTHPQSRGRIVRWMLEEIGQPYRTELLEYGTTMKAPAYLALNPM